MAQGILAIGFILVVVVMWGMEVSGSGQFDWKIANTSVWLSAAAYCETETYLSREYKGYSQGFVPMHTVISKKYDVQVGLLFDGI